MPRSSAAELPSRPRVSALAGTKRFRCAGETRDVVVDGKPRTRYQLGLSGRLLRRTRRGPGISVVVVVVQTAAAAAATQSQANKRRVFLDR